MLSNNGKSGGRYILIQQNVVISGYPIDIISLIMINYNIHNHNISLQKTNHSIKFLGVYIDNKLTWKSHVDNHYRGIGSNI